MIYTTLNAIRAHRPCASGWEKLLAHLGKIKADDEPLSLETILDSNGLDDALWCLRTPLRGPLRGLLRTPLRGLLRGLLRTPLRGPLRRPLRESGKPTACASICGLGVGRSDNDHPPGGGDAMTEDEAKTKWCPMARWTTEIASGPERAKVSGNWNRNDGRDSHPMCLASGCMAWRWALTAIAAEVLPDGIKHYPRQGYCGLAGKP